MTVSKVERGVFASIELTEPQLKEANDEYQAIIFTRDITAYAEQHHPELELTDENRQFLLADYTQRRNKGISNKNESLEFAFRTLSENCNFSEGTQ
jgi:hypothetical protein